MEEPAATRFCIPHHQETLDPSRFIPYFIYMKYDIAVIGSGPAGFEAARRAAASDKKTVVVTGTPPGGRATVGSLLPSKVWLHTANEAPPRSEPLFPQETETAAQRVRETIQQRVAWTRSSMEAAGVEIVSGHAVISDPHTIVVSVEESEPISIEASYIVVAAGSEPIFFPGVKPDADRLIAPRHTQKLTEIPNKLVMIGGGVTGIEYASVFARLGSTVQILSYDEVLPRSDREYTRRLTDHLESLGVSIRTGIAVERAENTGTGVVVTTRDGSEYTGDVGFIATGRAGDLTFLNGESPALATDESGRFLRVDATGKTSIESIYACGDITGPPLTANTAVHQARRAVDAILANGTSSNRAADTGNTEHLIEAVYTEPQLAGIGPIHELATRNDVTLHRRSYTSSMLSHVHGAAGDGEVKIWTDADDRILGAAAYGENAAEILAPVQVAMRYKGRLDELTTVPFAYPSITEVLTS